MASISFPALTYPLVKGDFTITKLWFNAFNDSLAGSLAAANNLSDLTDFTLARSNLGLGSAATQNVSAFFQVTNNLSEGNPTTIRTNISAAKSGANTDITSVYLNNTGLKIKDTNASDGLIIAPGSNLTADRTLTITTGDANRAINISGGDITSGTYTPTLTNVANLDASTAYICQYVRVGSVVTVSGKVDVDPTAAASTQLGITLPIASNFSTAEQCAGTAFASGVAGQGAAILADAVNDRAQLQFVTSNTTNQPMYFTFTYQVI